MKKVIKLSESELVKIIRNIVSESKFEKQYDVDKILDKINKYGMDSLTWVEKEIINNPDDSNFNFEGRDEVHDIITQLSKSKLIDPELVNLNEDSFEVYSIPGKDFCYFESYDFIRFNVLNDEEGNIMLVIDDDQVFSNEDEDETECRYELYSYIMDTWPEHEIVVECDDEDWRDSVGFM
jgi:hypothetical protein